MDVAQSATKATFVADLQGAFNALIPVKNQMADLVNTWFKNGFNSGGANPITDGDVAANNLTAATIQNAVTLMSQLANFFGGVALNPSFADYEATVQKMRTT